MLTWFHPATGCVRVKGVTSTTNIVLHGWLKTELTHILAHLPEPGPVLEGATGASWREAIGGQPTDFTPLPPLRMLLMMDHLAGHKTPEFVIWWFQHGILPLDTPLGGSWLNMTESIQPMLKRRALDGQYPTTPAQIIDWLEATARGWNADPTPFVWAGKRKQRRQRAYARRHSLGGSAAVTKRPLRFRCPVPLPISRCA